MTRCAHHLNWIQFTVKFWQKDNFVPCCPDNSFEHGWLVGKVILLAKNASHATVMTLKRTDRFTFSSHSRDIKAMLFKGLLEAFWLSLFICHLLDLAMILWV